MAQVVFVVLIFEDGLAAALEPTGGLGEGGAEEQGFLGVVEVAHGLVQGDSPSWK
jgi:hypothetical protein